VPLAVTGASVIGFQILTLVQPPAFVGGVLLWALAGALLGGALPRHRGIPVAKSAAA